MTQSTNETTVVITTDETGISVADNDKANTKVALDMEDAPYMEKEENTSPPPQAAPKPPPPPPAQDPIPFAPPPQEKRSEDNKDEPKKNKKKLFIFMGLGLVLLLCAGAAIYFFFMGSSSSDDPAMQFPPDTYVTRVADPSFQEYYHKDTESPVPHNIVLQPFRVTLKNNEGRTVFLDATFTFSTADIKLLRELTADLPEVRDAIYYYLTTKDYKFLTTPNNFPQIKRELLLAANKEVVSGKFDDILFNKYVIE